MDWKFASVKLERLVCEPDGPTTMEAMLEKVPERALMRGMIPVMEP